MTKNAGRQASRLLALALASGTLVAAGATGANAAQGSTSKHQLVGKAKTSVVEVSLNLPAATPLVNSLPKLGSLDLSKPVTLDLVQTVGALSRNQITGAVDSANSTSTLGAGTLFAKGGLLAPLNRSITATLARPGTFNANNGVAFSQGPLSISIPTLQASAVKNLLGTAGTGRLASLDLGHLTDLLPAGTLDSLNTQLEQIIGDAQGNGGATETITTLVTNLLDQINNLLPTATAPVKAVLTDLANQIKALQKALPKLIATLEDGSIVDLAALTSIHDIATTATNAVSSKAGVSLAHLSLLGGFVTLDGFDNNAKVTANGKANGAHAVVNPNVAKVHIGAPAGLDLVLGPDGLVATVLGDSALPKTVVGLVNTLVESVQNLLSVAGVRIAPATYHTVYNKNHSAASVTGSGLMILVNNPLNAANTNFSKALVGVKIGAFEASAGAAAKAITGGPTPRHTTPRVTPPTDLPHTGANLPLTAGAAIALLGAAAVIRRRMVHTES